MEECYREIQIQGEEGLDSAFFKNKYVVFTSKPSPSVPSGSLQSLQSCQCSIQPWESNPIHHIEALRAHTESCFC